MDLVTRRWAWTALPIVLVLAVLTALLVPRLATASTPSPNSAQTAASSASVYAPNFTDVSTVYTDTVSHGDGTRVPDIISTSEDHAVVAWREGIVPNHVDQGYIRYSHTENGGATWSPPQMLVQETDKTTWNDVVLFQQGDKPNDPLFAYVTGDAASSAKHGAGKTTAMVVKRSTDQGHTWFPYTLTTDLVHLKENIVFSGRPLQLGPDRVAIPYWASGRENGVLLSNDHELKVWTPGRHPDNAGMLPGENQIAISQDDDGDGQDLVMVARAGGNAAKATSSDGGSTWGHFTEDPELPSLNIAKDFFTKDRNGQYLYIYNSGTATAGHVGYRDQLAYKVKPKGNASWSAETPLIDTALSDPAQADGTDWDTYPMADEYAPGKFYVVWEADTMHIMVGKLDVSGTAK